MKFTEDQKKRALEWAAALRSGKYEQARRTLRTTDGFCCLGVYAKIRGAEWEFNRGMGNFRLTEAECSGTSYLSPRLSRELGFSTGDEDWSQGVFAVMNDDDEKSFDTIATYIEEFVQGDLA